MIQLKKCNDDEIIFITDTDDEQELLEQSLIKLGIMWSKIDINQLEITQQDKDYEAEIQNLQNLQKLEKRTLEAEITRLRNVCKDLKDKNFELVKAVKSLTQIL